MFSEEKPENSAHQLSTLVKLGSDILIDYHSLKYLCYLSAKAA